MEDTHMKVQNLIAGLAAEGIIVTEWDTLLHCRHNVPLICRDFSFLVEDDLMEAACQFTEKQGFPPSENMPRLITSRGKCETIARHFDCLAGHTLQRVNLLPRSFAGFRINELYLAPLDLSKSCLKPVSVLTAGLAPVVASLVRLISQVSYNDGMSVTLKQQLCSLISYNLFDMSYEGDIMVLEEESDEEVEQERRQAVQQFQTWEGWRDEEIWIMDAVQAIIEGNGHYRNLPATASV